MNKINKIDKKEFKLDKLRKQKSFIECQRNYNTTPETISYTGKLPTKSGNWNVSILAFLIRE